MGKWRSRLNLNEKVGLVLSGGGARAAYEVGVMKAIYSGKCRSAQGNPPEVLCGTGAGAYNAAVAASRLPGQYPSAIDYLTSLWVDEIPREGLSRNNRIFRKRLDTAQFFDLPYLWRRPLKSIVQYAHDFAEVVPAALGGKNSPELWIDTSPLRRLITESVSLEAIRDGEVERPYRSLRIVAAECGSGAPRAFGNADFTEETGYSLVMASCSTPGLFPAVEIRGKRYAYGGPQTPAPLAPAVEAGCTVIHVVHTEPGAAPVRQAAAGVVVHQYRPQRELIGAGGLLHFTRELAEDAIAAGERDALAHNCAESGCIL
jgi:NTE family protein